MPDAELIAFVLILIKGSLLRARISTLAREELTPYVSTRNNSPEIIQTIDQGLVFSILNNTHWDRGIKVISHPLVTWTVIGTNTRICTLRNQLAEERKFWTILVDLVKCFWQILVFRISCSWIQKRRTKSQKFRLLQNLSHSLNINTSVVSREYLEISIYTYPTILPPSFVCTQKYKTLVQKTELKLPLHRPRGQISTSQIDKTFKPVHPPGTNRQWTVIIKYPPHSKDMMRCNHNFPAAY